ncbi:MAG: TolC family protein, partial [Acidobacteriaceae bacterium]
CLALLKSFTKPAVVVLSETKWSEGPGGFPAKREVLRVPPQRAQIARRGPRFAQDDRFIRGASSKICPAIGILLFLSGNCSTTLRAQKLANAPSAVMLAKNIRRQNAEDSPVAPHAAAMPGDALQSTLLPDSPQDDGERIATTIPAQLTLREAEQIAIHNNPRIHVAQLLARAQHQVFRETRSAYLPQVQAGAVAAKANSGSRFTFDGLRSTRLITHAGGGLDFHQLLTDFGHTANLIASSRLYEKAQNAQAMASTLDIVLITDQAFYSAVEAQATMAVAKQTVATRQTTDRQIAELTRNKLRSTIDLAFAEENLAQAKLLALDAETQYNSDLNALTSVLGFDRPMNYTLVESGSAIAAPPPDEDRLTRTALKQRPDLMALDYDQRAAKKYTRAEWEQLLPTLSTVAVVGGTPVRNDQYFTTSWFGAIGADLEVPVFSGFRYTAEAHEAEDRAKASQENLRDLRDRVVRDVRDAWLQCNTSYQKIAVTQQMLEASNMGLKLAQARYKLGLSSIVELSQSQLEQTQASIENVNARYEYQLSLAALNYQLGNLP